MRTRNLRAALIAASVASVAAVAATASAAIKTPACDQPFDAIDTNDDGKISDTEAVTWRKKVFRNLDDDKDGDVSRWEFLECHAGPPPVATFRNPDRYLRYRDDKRFSEIDSDSDNKVYYEEYVNAGRNAFRFSQGGPNVTPKQYYEQMRGQAYDPESADRNADGIITADEAAADVDRAFANLDDDGDGIITKSEWQSERRISRADKVFRRLDADGDQRVSMGEWIAADEKRLKDGKSAGSVWGHRGYFLGL